MSHRHARRSSVVAGTLRAACVLSSCLLGCERNVSVTDPGAQTDSARGTIIGAPIAPGSSSSVPSSNGAAGSIAVAPGGAATPLAGGPATMHASAGDSATAKATLMQGIDQNRGASDSYIESLEVLFSSLDSINVPAVGSDGVSLLQYSAADVAVTLHVAWSGAADRWYEAARPHHIYTAASGGRHVSLLYSMSSYGIYADGGADELSGTPDSYKEFLTAHEPGFAWVDYPLSALPAAQNPVFGGSSYGTIVLQSWTGVRSLLTDPFFYRARIDLSRTHVAFVEYASTAPGSIGQIVVQPIAGGAAITAAPSVHHQDRPAIDGDWVVWEEYVAPTDSVIRARNLATGEVRDLSASVGFRTNPDIMGTRVIWEDQRSGNGDIYLTDLAAPDGDHVVVSGAGHSAATRLTFDGLVWIETLGDNMGLMRARWIR